MCCNWSSEKGSARFSFRICNKGNRERPSCSIRYAATTINFFKSKGRKFSHEDWQAYFAAHVSEESAFIDTKSELDYYLEERPVPQTEHNFDILNWWKSNGAKFLTLQAIARDFLAIPISTVAFESSFSTGGQFVTPHRSRLRPDTLETLMCNQD
ncbi:zinc finger BED domain-containing protein RICESLEEPER 2-like [Arachis duranensis]|uniref:Zinc finger BED domain-containing protein RICESLEEPER 2-like n=1 Tax=Arachis duranensis TaxID=130453 RepID=A0A6P5MHI5_ARADU|nr:zinc finger BED domain-containing protein RICESLEEPER 2-like [Arachis duranensis]